MRDKRKFGEGWVILEINEKAPALFKIVFSNGRGDRKEFVCKEIDEEGRQEIVDYVIGKDFFETEKQAKKHTEKILEGFEDIVNSLISQRNKEQEKQKKQEKQHIKINIHGGVYGNLVVEPIGNNKYLINNKGNKEIQEVRTQPTENGSILGYYLEIDEEKYYFTDKPLSTTLFETPSMEIVEKYVNGEYKVKKEEEISESVLTYLKLLYDLEKEQYYHITLIGILQSWLLPILRTVFYLGFRAKKGSGKTVFLEGLSILSRHGFLVGDISQAGIARATDKQQLSLFYDEVDIRKGRDNEVYKVLRQGYRRDNPIVRLRDRTYEPEKFDAFGFKAFTWHSDTEAALLSRTIPISMRATKDKALPILNMHKKELGRRIFEDLFFWYMDNIAKLVASVSPVSFLSRISEGKGKDIKQLRNELFEEITADFNKNEIELLSKYFGRNTELLFISLMVCKHFNLDLTEILEKTFNEKAEEEEGYSEDYYISLLSGLLEDIFEEYKETTSFWLQKGEHIGCFYFRYQSVYEKYREKLKSKDIRPVSPKTFKSFLREFGFAENINIKKERFKTGNSSKTLKALIFDTQIMNELNLEKPENAPTIKKLDGVPQAEVNDA